MRKIRTLPSMDEDTFEPTLALYLNDTETKSGKKMGEWKIEPKKRYTPDEQSLIDYVNKLMIEQNNEILTQEESDFLIDPTGERWGKKQNSVEEKLNPEELQRLSGFTVEKKITFYDDINHTSMTTPAKESYYGDGEGNTEKVITKEDLSEMINKFESEVKEVANDFEKLLAKEKEVNDTLSEVTYKSSE